MKSVVFVSPFVLSGNPRDDPAPSQKYLISKDAGTRILAIPSRLQIKTDFLTTGGLVISPIHYPPDIEQIVAYI